MTDIKTNHENENNYNIEEWLLLDDFFEWEFDTDTDGQIIINGVSYDYEITLSPRVPDSMCMRVTIDNIYYHFG